MWGWEECKRTGLPSLLVLEGHPGVGKTRIVQEFFAPRLSESQSDPSFWPRRLEVASDQLLAGRGRIVPQRFEFPAKAEFHLLGSESRAISMQTGSRSEPSFPPSRLPLPHTRRLRHGTDGSGAWHGRWRWH